MSETVTIAIITATVPFLALLGKGASYIIGLVQQQATATIEAKDREIGALREKLRQAGIEP